MSPRRLFFALSAWILAGWFGPMAYAGQAYGVRVTSEHNADTTDLRRFRNYHVWRDKKDNDLAISIWQYLCDYHPIMMALATVTAVAEGTPAFDPPRQSWFPKAPPLPKPAGQVIRVATVEELFRAADDVKTGGTILLADGNYMMPRSFELHTDNVTLRSESGRRERVVLDGARSRHRELVGITNCSGATIADLTIQNIQCNGFKINSDRFATHATIYNCVIHNIWERGVKGPAVRVEDRERFRPSDCRIQYCLFYNDRPKKYEDDSADTAANFGGNYVGGIDAMYPRRWTISDNVFIGIQGRTRGARGAVFLWQNAEDCIIERNIIIDCDSGICLGNSFKPADVQVHCRGCIVRNNFITHCPEQGILADYTRDCQIVHNTIHDPGSRLQRLIRMVHDNDGLLVANNLLSGPPMRIETDKPPQSRGNLTTDLSDDFVDARAGNLHLIRRVPEVVDAAQPLTDVTTDIDGQRRDAKPDIGAHEWMGEHNQQPLPPQPDSEPRRGVPGSDPTHGVRTGNAAPWRRYKPLDGDIRPRAWRRHGIHKQHRHFEGMASPKWLTGMPMRLVRWPGPADSLINALGLRSGDQQ